jgi:hypothetical protein
MDTKDKDWLAEIERRAAVYDKQADGGTGRLTSSDYFGMAALTVLVSAILWMWVV